MTLYLLLGVSALLNVFLGYKLKRKINVRSLWERAWEDANKSGNKTVRLYEQYHLGRLVKQLESENLLTKQEIDFCIAQLDSYGKTIRKNNINKATKV